MLFYSIEFVLFFLALFSLYYFVCKERGKWQNILLLVASYVFYGWVNWKILFLLIASTLVFYGLGLAISKAETPKKKQLFTTIGVVFGVATLLYFKYTNFFIVSFKELFEGLGFHTHLHTFNIIIPVGISFYTFRLLSYVIDLGRNKYEPTKDLIAFSTYVAFFPCVLSGPIDRPNTFIPQLQKRRVFDYDLSVDGLRQILWGAFKKIVIADALSIYVDQIYDSYPDQTGSTLLLTAFLYTFVVYADFSGYTDMSIGVAKLLGIRVTKNFNFPLYAQNIADYWRRWHISLTSWLTDYVFMPLNIKWRDWGNWGTILAIIITFVIIGLWHEAKWTFALFGLYHGLLYIPLILSGKMSKKTKQHENKLGFPTLKTSVNAALTFFLVSLGLIIFKSDSINQLFNYINHLFSSSLFSIPDYTLSHCYLFYIGIMLVVEWFQRKKEYGLQIDGIKSSILRWCIYLALIIIVFCFYPILTKQSMFIYFQF